MSLNGIDGALGWQFYWSSKLDGSNVLLDSTRAQFSNPSRPHTLDRPRFCTVSLITGTNNPLICPATANRNCQSEKRIHFRIGNRPASDLRRIHAEKTRNKGPPGTSGPPPSSLSWCGVIKRLLVIRSLIRSMVLIRRFIRTTKNWPG